MPRISWLFAAVVTLATMGMAVGQIPSLDGRTTLGPIGGTSPGIAPSSSPATLFPPRSLTPFDPYATTPSRPGLFGANPVSPGGGLNPPSPGLLNGLFSRGTPGGLTAQNSAGIVGSGTAPMTQFDGLGLNAPVFAVPQNGVPGSFDNPSVIGPPASYQPQIPFQPQSGFANPPGNFPDSIYPATTPSTLFPGGLFTPGGGFGGLSTPAPVQRVAKFYQGLRLRHEYVYSGDDPDALDVNTTDASAIFALPNFLYSTQPLYVIPSFTLNLWEGPDSTTGADLPGQTYGGYIDAGYNSDPNRILGTELGVRVGAFSDFDTFNSDTIRVLGKGLVNFRLTPASTVKFGVLYLDRVDWKLLPAGGILYQPSAYERYDLFFPQPKLARYFRTIGTRDVWWYLAGDYGGGSWTIERDDGTEDQFDLNELRALFGFEWGYSDQIRQGRRTAFAEIGYAFDRELVYRENPNDNLKLDDGIVFRLGLGY